MMWINKLHALQIPTQLTLAVLTTCRKLLQPHFPVYQTKWTLKILFSLPALSTIFLRGQVSNLLRTIRKFQTCTIFVKSYPIKCICPSIDIEATPPNNIRNRPIGNTNPSSSYTLVDIKESPNTTPRNVSPILPAHPKSSINGNDHYATVTSSSSINLRHAGAQILESNSVQPIPLSALRTDAVVNNVNALLSQEILANQQIMTDNRHDAAKEEPITNGDYSLGMTLDDIMNMYRLKGENHYMSETSSNASSCSSVCGWSYGGPSNINGTLEHNNIFDNRMMHGNGKDKGSHGNLRNGNTHHSQFKGSNNFSYKFGLDPIPEYDVPEDPPIFQPLVPPAVVVPNPFKENISFPTTLQARPNDGRFNICRATVSSGVVSTVAQVSSHQKQLMSASNINNTIPPCVMNHSSDDRKSESISLVCNIIFIYNLKNACILFPIF